MVGSDPPGDGKRFPSTNSEQGRESGMTLFAHRGTGDLEVTEIEVNGGVLIIPALSTQQSPCYPLCSPPAAHMHSRYTRQIADLPCAGQRVHLLILVRKGFCQMAACQRKIFVERFTPFAAPWAQVTARLFQIVQIVGLATGGRWGSPSDGSVEYPYQPDDHSPSYHSSAYRASWEDFTAWY